jgi:hypothetical protein
MTKREAWEKFSEWSDTEEPTNWETFLFTWDACAEEKEKYLKKYKAVHDRTIIELENQVEARDTRIKELKALLDEADQEDFFGTEGWRHLLYEEPMPKEDYLYDLAKEKRLREESS